MSPDSRQGPMPLADAIIAWSDPALVEAIRTEEAKFSPGELEALGQYTLADVSAFRRVPSRPLGLTPLPTDKRALLKLAWEKLFAAFRPMLEQGEIRLRGVPAITFGEPVPEDLPASQATTFLFDPAASAVFVGLTTYVGVTATRTAAETSTMVQPAVARRQELPLLDAVAAWCDRELVGRVRMLEAHIRDEDIDAVGRNRIGPRPDRVPDRMLSLAYKDGFTAAWHALIRDFQRRIERGELGLQGVQTWPLRKVEREPIPGLWASELSFKLNVDQVHVVQFGRLARSYAAVIATGPANRGCAADAINSGSVVQAAVVAEPPAAVMECNGKTERTARGGRTSYEPIIEAGLREHWSDLFPNGPPEDTPVWSHLASRLAKRMRAKGAVLRKNVPQEDTIRTRLPKIYTRVLNEKAGVGPSAQTNT